MRRFLLTVAIITTTWIGNAPILSSSTLALYQNYWHQGNVRTIAFLLGIWVLALTSFLVIANARSTALRIAWSALILLSTILATLSVMTVGTYINYQTIEIVWNARYSTNAFFSSHWLEVLKACGSAALLPVVLLLSPCRARSIPKILAFVPLAPIAALFFYFYHTHGVGTEGLPPQYSSIAVLAGWASYVDHAPERAEVELPRTQAPLIKHILFIVDESVRADFLDINGATDITPFLQSIEPRLINFGFATSGNNCTATSNALLRMGFNPRHGENETTTDLRAHPSIWKYAHAAGFVTAFVDNQRDAGQLQNYMDGKEVALIDIFHQFPGSPLRMQRDHSSIEVIRKIQSENQATFTYVDKAGAHFHYENSYPPNWQKFNPHLRPLEPARDRERMVNSYKNSVSWSVDEFFRKLVPAVDWNDTVLIYTSDHGQNLLDDGSPITHCRVKNPSEAEGMVPLFVLTANPQLRQRFAAAAARNYNRASHFQIFSTLLDMMGYEPQQAQQKYYLSLFSPAEVSLGFTSAELVKRFGVDTTWRSMDWHPVGFFGKPQRPN